jgi:hypothetical protein
VQLQAGINSSPSFLGGSDHLQYKPCALVVNVCGLLHLVETLSNNPTLSRAPAVVTTATKKTWPKWNRLDVCIRYDDALKQSNYDAAADYPGITSLVPLNPSGNPNITIRNFSIAVQANCRTHRPIK